MVWSLVCLVSLLVLIGAVWCVYRLFGRLGSKADLVFLLLLFFACYCDCGVVFDW